MTMGLQPLRHRPQRTPETTARRLLLHHPEPAPGSFPIVGKPQKVEAPSPDAVLRLLGRPTGSKLEQLGLGGVESQAVLAKTLWQDVPYPARILLVAEDQNQIGRETDHESAASQPRPHIPLEPPVH